MKPSDFSDSSDFSESKRDDSIYSLAQPSPDGQNQTRYRTVRCPICQTSVAVRDDDLGKTLVCPDCDTKIDVPIDLPYNETRYEKRYYNEERLRQDKLFSPLRNPNREGIDLDAANVYRLGASENGTPDVEATRRSFQFRIVECPLCNTGVAVTRAELGRTLVCPDCGTKYDVPNDLDFSQTEDERNLFDAEKLRRDELLSPLRNPNREGIDVEAASYSLDVNSKFVEQARTKNRPVSAIFLTDAERAAREEEERLNEAASNSIQTENSEFLRESPNAERGSSETATRKSQERDSDFENDSNVDSDWIPVRCRVCGTLTYAPRQNLGKTFHCVDCGAETVVSLAFQELEDAAAVQFAPRDRGTYRIDEKSFAAANGSRLQGTSAPSEFRLRDAFEAARRGKNQTASQSDQEAADNTRLQSRSESPKIDGESVSKSAESDAIRNDLKNGDKARKKQIKKAEKAAQKRKKRAARTNRSDRQNETPARSLRRRDGEWIWTRPEPPKNFPLFNGAFRALASSELLGRNILTTGLACLVAFLIVLTLKHPFGVVILWAVPSVLFLGFFLLYSADSFACCFTAGNSGALRVELDAGEESLAGKLLYFCWIFATFATAFAVGVLILNAGNALFERFGSLESQYVRTDVEIQATNLPEGTTTSESEEEEESKILSFGKDLRSIGILTALTGVFFPVFFLSSIQSELIFCPLTKEVVRTLASKCGIWAQFYLASLVLLAVPAALLLFNGGNKALWGVFLISAVLIPELYALLLGRLSWIIENAIQDAEFDD